MFAFGTDTAMIITFSGLLIVFAVLILLVGIIKLFGVIFSSNPKKTENKENEVPNKVVPVKPQNTETLPLFDDDEVVAVISAAVFAYGKEQNKTYSIRSIKPVKTERTRRSAWADAGVMQNVRPF